MEISRKVKLRIDVVGKNLRIWDLPTLSLVLGTTSIAGNYNMYPKIVRGKGYWDVPIKMVEERIQKMEAVIKKTADRLELMSEVLKVAKTKNVGGKKK